MEVAELEIQTQASLFPKRTRSLQLKAGRVIICPKLRHAWESRQSGKGGRCGESLGKHNEHLVLRNRRKAERLGWGLGHRLVPQRSSKDVHTQSVELMSAARICGNRDFAGCVKLRILRWRIT